MDALPRRYDSFHQGRASISPKESIYAANGELSSHLHCWLERVRETERSVLLKLEITVVAVSFL